MAIKFNLQYHDCANCAYEPGCKIKEERQEAIAKLTPRVDNIVTSTDNFLLYFDCSDYTYNKFPFDFKEKI